MASPNRSPLPPLELDRAVVPHRAARLAVVQGSDEVSLVHQLQSDRRAFSRDEPNRGTRTTWVELHLRASEPFPDHPEPTLTDPLSLFLAHRPPDPPPLL